MASDENKARRRRQIAEAVWRLAARDGLEAVTLRQVADEAGVSMRLVQYYFGNRTTLLLAALEILNEEAEAAAQQRIGALGSDIPARELVRAILMELLPLDEDRRRRYVVQSAYFVRFLTDPQLQEVARTADPALESLLASILTADPTIESDDTFADAELLIAFAFGLQAEMLLNQLDEPHALRLLDRTLNRILGNPH
ncbi:TetR/AcrR family transcriptional regulator [Kribbella solani]|uniref:AcrR family transcriptional regulator n=1 Tax=Kribbella solani TaxID=236067 RepID=A0A841E1H7_9ACTN|nr:TetR family transcriptional regulator C-terminal domain-containing protein [Kribbella solani]MBB5981248.1 AcrR family transcriptional regulator [Kribbella solani]MDX2968771.1 TetR family transcriptional regulator C-terminal domain-containing protein [Kribbella solani]